MPVVRPSREYLTGMPAFMPPGTPVYGHHGAPHMHPQHAFHPAMRGGGGRRHDAQNDPGAHLRSPLLEEFRANKAKKWDLRVRTHISLTLFYDADAAL